MKVSGRTKVLIAGGALLVTGVTITHYITAHTPPSAVCEAHWRAAVIDETIAYNSGINLGQGDTYLNKGVAILDWMQAHHCAQDGYTPGMPQG